VLYADDLLELRELMQLVLMRDGHTLEAFADASLALPRIEAAPGDFDVVITDHHMPVMNGLEFVQHLRQTPYAGRILVFSSELAPAVREAYLALGVDHVLAKPVLPAELRRLLARFAAATGASA
jgi:two-component system chemotaxis response regulator CheY